MTSELQQIYLSDHSAMMTAEIELIERCRSANESDSDSAELSNFLLRLSNEVQEEQNVVRGLLEQHGHSPDILKELSGWVVEKIGRLKFNGQLTGYSNLSRVLELEILISSAQSRSTLWKTCCKFDADDQQFESFVSRAQAQTDMLSQYHDEATNRAFH